MHQQEGSLTALSKRVLQSKQYKSCADGGRVQVVGAAITAKAQLSFSNSSLKGSWR